MKKKVSLSLVLSVSLLTAFVLWTLAVRFIDVKPIGPEGSEVGFAFMNQAVHKLTGVNSRLYTLTDVLGLVPFCVCIGFGILGLVQWIRRGGILKVDRSLIALGVFYAVTIGLYLFFEIVPINYRPVLIDGALEVSYPSSTTLLVMCVMPTAIIQLCKRLRNRLWKITVTIITSAFIVFMVASRLISGVHWITDIIGGALLSAGLVLMYYYVCKIISTD